MAIYRNNNALDAYLTVLQAANTIARACEETLQRIQTGPTDVNSFLHLLHQMAGARATMLAQRTVTGIGAVAQQQTGDAAYDFSAEALAFLTAVADVKTWLDANIPGAIVDGKKTPHSQWVDDDGFIKFHSMAQAETSGLIAPLQGVIAAAQ